MIEYGEYVKVRDEAARMIRGAGLVVSDEEIERMDVADFGLSNLRGEGAQILSLLENDKIAARVIALLPGQAEPEHWHESSDGVPGKHETLRVVSGTLHVYLPGEGLSDADVPLGKAHCYTARREHILRPCDTLVIEPGTRHWFRTGGEGAVFYTISTTARDLSDPFTDPNVVRTSIIVNAPGA